MVSSTYGLHENSSVLNILPCIGSTFMELDEVVIPAENLLGKENQGFEIIMSSMEVYNDV